MLHRYFVRKNLNIRSQGIFNPRGGSNDLVVHLNFAEIFDLAKLEFILCKRTCQKLRLSYFKAKSE